MASQRRPESGGANPRRSTQDTVRRDALAALIDAIRSADTRTILLRGPAGAGKTWLAEAAMAAAEAESALCGRGKFSENEGQAALGPIMAALSSLLRAALDRFYDPQAGLASLADGLGVGLDVLISAGLSLPQLETSATALAHSDRRLGIARIAAAAIELLRWTEKLGLPRVLLLDDWNRASSDAIDLIRSIAQIEAGAPLSLLLAERAPSREPPSPPEATTILSLGALDDAEVTRFLAQRLGDARQAELALATLRQGLPRLPFDLEQIANGLIRDAVFTRSGDSWSIDSAKALRLTFDAESAIERLSPAARDFAAALALWGDAAPLAPFRDALDPSHRGDVDTTLDLLRAEEIVRISGSEVSFCHDRLRDAALRAASDRLAWLAGAMAERIPRGSASNLETVALHLRLYAGLDGADPAKWRDRFTHGATAARGRGDLDAAARFAEAALALRDVAPPGNRLADRVILREALLAAADRDDPQTEARARRLIETGRTSLERYRDYEMSIVALRLAGQNEAGWRLACEGLRVVGIAPPSDRPRLSLLIAAALWWITRNRAPAPAELAEKTFDAFTGVAAYAATIAYHRNPAAAAVIGFRGSLRAGRASRGAAFWWSTDAFLFAALGAYRHAADAGERALASFDSQRVLRAATLYQAMFFGLLWRRPLASLRDRFRDVTRIAMTEGHAIPACYGLRIYVMAGWRTAPSLDRLRDEAHAALTELEAIGEISFVDEMRAMVAMLDGLTGQIPWDPGLWRDDIPTRNHVIDLELSNLAGDWAETLRRAERLRPLRRDYDIQVDSVVLRFHENLARLRCGLDMRRADRRFLAAAARLNPVDHAPKLLLLDAERLRVRQAPDAAILDAYAGAVAAADLAASRLDAALALTCAADFASAIGHHGATRDWRRRANRAYAEWGVRIETGATDPADPALLAEALTRADAAERADRAKSRLLAHVGHELRTPLQALGSMLDLADGSAEPPDIAGVRDVLAGLTSVVEDLNIADEYVDRQTAGLGRQVDLAAMLGSEAALWHRDDRLALRLDPAPIRVQVAADRVRQIVRNLLSNAIKYGGEAPILLELTLEPLDTAEVHVRIAVQDGGPGLSAAEVDSLFDTFERGAFAGDGRGAGLGLALSRRLANRLGGTLDARNVEPHGARFELQFVAPRAVENAAVDSLRILLVEDSPLIRPLFAALLAQAGHQVVEAGTAQAAREAWACGTFDLVILDLGLPDADGLSLLAEIREAGGAGAELPTIILSASARAEADALAARDARVAILRKPASADALHATVAALTGAMAPATSGAGPDLDALYEAARNSVIDQARLCLESVPDARFVHQLAGLAAQFGWCEIADAVESLEAALLEGASPAAARARLSQAIAAMGAA